MGAPQATETLRDEEEVQWNLADLNTDPRSSIETGIPPEFGTPTILCIRLFTTQFDPGGGGPVHGQGR